MRQKNTKKKDQDRQIRDRAGALADKMSAVAKTHANDILANQYARVAKRLEDLGEIGLSALTELEQLTVRVFHRNYVRH